MSWKPHRGWLVGLALLLLLAIVPGIASAQASFGSNWVAEYWNNTDFAGVPVATVVYPTGLNFNWGTGHPTGPDGQPLLAVPVDNFSARFQTTENFATAGEYTFFGFVDDRIRVFIDGIEVYSQDVPGEFSFVRTLTAGIHSLRVDYVELTDTAILQFQWQLGAVGVPPPVQPEVPVGPTARVVNVRGLSLRSGPYLGASFIGVLRPDNAYVVHAKNNDESGGFTWYNVTAGERTGWASGRYLVIDGNRDGIPEQGTVFQELDGSPDRGVIGVTRAVMNFRLRPSIRSVRIGQIPWGGEVQILNRTVQGGHNFWFHVRYQGQVGWIFAPFITVRGNIEAVPIR
jgi:hypothetical protein